MGWIYLLFAGIAEIGFAVGLKMMDGHKNIPWSVFFYVSIITSFMLLQQAAKTLPIGTAYAVWTGMGGAGAAIVGIIYFGDPATTPRIVFLTLLVASVVGLKLTSGH
ncbi:MAG: DMT family transporter [Rickettsiales bacterium]